MLGPIFPQFCLLCHRRVGASPICVSCRPPLVIADGGARCELCYSVLGPGSSVCCPACQLDPPAFGKLRYLWEYHKEGGALIRALKNRPSEALIRYASDNMVTLLRASFGVSTPHIVVPIPSHPSSLRKRLLDVPLRLAMLIQTRVPETKIVEAIYSIDSKSPQKSLTWSSRHENARKRLRLRAQSIPEGPVLLLDDVMTSGSSAIVAASLLKDAGVAVQGTMVVSSARPTGIARGPA